MTRWTEPAASFVRQEIRTLQSRFSLCWLRGSRHRKPSGDLSSGREGEWYSWTRMRLNGLKRLQTMCDYMPVRKRTCCEAVLRSEERRVGKEGRFGGAREE